MEKYLVLENIRFVILLFGALTFGGMSWLYFDAIAVKRQLNVWLSGVGSGILAFGFLATIWGFGYASEIRYLGYLVLGLGVWLKPMSKRPPEEMKQEAGSMNHEPEGEGVKQEAWEEGKVESVSVENSGFEVEEVNHESRIKNHGKKKLKVMAAVWLTEIKMWMMPLLPGWVGLGYFRLGSVGLERHLNKLGWGMFSLLVAEILDNHVYFQNWSDPRIYLAVSRFGFFWIAQKLFLFIGLFVISLWVFSYLLKRFETQLTLFLCTMTIFAFAVATIGFTFTTAGNIRERFVDYQRMTLELLRYSEERRAQEMILRAKDLGSRQAVIDLLAEGSAEQANKEIGELQKNGELTGVWIMNSGGNKLLSLTDGSVTDWSVTGRAQKGESVWGYELESGVLSLAVAVPVKSEDKISGTIVLSKKIDSNFLQGISTKVRSGLWVYKQNQIVSFADDGQRVRLLVGLSDTGEEFSTEVLANGKDVVRLSVSMAGESYMGVWGALKNANGTPLGSLAVVSRVDGLWEIVQQALTRDYQLAVLSLLLSLLPAVLISRYFVRQLV